MQPQASGSGWGAPGRALQGLGKSIASLGDVFEGLGQEQIAEQDFQDKMLMLKTDNELGLNQVETQANYQGNGDDYLPSRTEYYATTTNDAVSRMQPRNQQKGALFFEQRRGPYLERDAKFGGQRRQDTLIGTINDTVSTEYGKLATVPPEEFEQRFNETLSGVDAIIRSAPLPDSLKDKLAGQAAERGYQVLNGLAEDPDTAPEIVPKILKMIEEMPEEIDGGALEEVPAQPDKGAEGVQGLPGSPSGPAPQRTSALEIQDFTAGRTNYRPLPAQNVKNIVLHDVSGNPKNRRLPSGGNIPHYHITFDDKGIYHEIPFDRQAPHARAFNKDSIGIAYIGFEGDKLSPQAVANGARAVQMVQQQFGVPAERILTHPGAGPSATKSGKDPREAAWRGEVLAYLGQGGAEVADAGRPVEARAVNQRGLVQYAGLGGPKEEEVGAPRGQNKIPAEPQLVQRPQLVREGVQVADASGRFVPQERQNWRSVNSHLRDLLIKNSGRFKRLEQKAIRAQDTLQAKALKQEQQQTYDEGFDLWRSGKLTDQWIEEHRPSLAPNDDQKLFRILRNQNRFIDPETYADLLDRLDRDPQGTLSQAREDLAEGKISASFYDRIETRARREMKPETKTPGWAKRWMGEVREQIGTHQGDKWEQVEKSQAHMQDFEDYIQREIDAGTLDYDKVAKRAKQTVDGYRERRAKAKRTTLSIPLELPGVTAETMTFEQLDTAEAKLKEELARAFSADPLAKAGDPAAAERVRGLFRERANVLKEWRTVLTNEAIAKGEKVPPASWAKPSKLGGPKPEQGTVNQQTPQAQGVKGQSGTQSGSAPNRPQAAQGESRPVGGALGVVPLAENPDGSVSLSVPGMILEPWRAFQRGLARESVRGMTDEAGNPLYDPNAQSEDAMTAASVPLAATSFETAAKALASNATRDVAKSIGGSFRDRWKAARLNKQFKDEASAYPGTFASEEISKYRAELAALEADVAKAGGTTPEHAARIAAAKEKVADVEARTRAMEPWADTAKGYQSGPEELVVPKPANADDPSGYQRAVEAQAMEREGRSPFSVVPNSASMETFFDGAVKIEPGASVSQAALYERYVRAAENAGGTPGSFDEFKRFVAEMGIMPRKTKDGVRYVGIRLGEDSD